MRGAADAALQRDQLEEAREGYRQLVEMAPAEAAGYAGLGLTALKAADYEAAERNLLAARERTPDDPELALALAVLRIETGDSAGAMSLVDEALERDPAHLAALWARAGLAATVEGPESDARAAYLSRLAGAAPGNLAVLVEAADAHLVRGELDAGHATLEQLRQVAPDFQAGARAAFEAAEDAILAGDGEEARARFLLFRAAFEVTVPYQASLEELRSHGGALAGVAQLDFSFLVTLRVQEPEVVLAALRFSDASELAGLEALASGGAVASPRSGEAAAGEPVAPASALDPASALALGDFDGDGDEDLFWSSGGEGRLLRVALGRYAETPGDLPPNASGDARVAVWGDFDDDRRLDLWLAGSAPRLLRNDPAGTFQDIALPGGASAGGPANDAFFADLDQDGDLDVFEARSGPNRLFRNNGDRTFAEMAASFGVQGPNDASTRSAAFADIDNDRDIDIVLAEGGSGLRLLFNERGGRFEDRSDLLAGGAIGEAGGGASGAAEAAGDQAVAVGDVNGDGWLDIAAAGESGLRILAGSSSGTLSAGQTIAWDGFVPADLLFVDFDNDGWLDMAAAGSPPASTPAAQVGSGLRLFRNDGEGRLEDAGNFLPSDFPRVSLRSVQSFDYNEDGDADLVVLGSDGAPRLLRNDGGNANHFLKLDLTGLGEGSRKNNRFGIGARVEVRAGDMYQVRTVTDPTTLIGLDGHLKADVIRVYWPNGVPQDLYFPGTDQDLIEQQTLKGSCPMLYAWNGDRFEFVGDMMWKSALGMPLGILGSGERAYAPPFPSLEYRRLPDDFLQPLGEEYVVQITEELWETIYVDEVKLVAVDHPAETGIYVNEAFVPPAPVELELWRTGARHRPVSATDDMGRDQLGVLAERDFGYVSSFRPGRYQGIAEPHALILDLGPAAASGDVTLFLTGWIFPTDASINIAVDQSAEAATQPPALDVIGPDGEWQTAIPSLGFPSGKDKTVIADLRGLFPSGDRRVRIRSNLMIYWDEAFFTTGPAHPHDDEVRITSLPVSRADLRYRGFSREYRKGGRYGPHWFDYSSVTTRPRWHDLEGWYTRFGDVTELVAAGDDQPVIANAGDELTLRFDAAGLPELPEGWSRTFLIYSDGWVKDGDLNTATGDRVGPLPYREAPIYPYDPSLPPPGRAVADALMERYQTRYVEPQRNIPGGAGR